MTRDYDGPEGQARALGKAPAFQLYARDFLGDQKTMLMTTEQIGALFMLLMSCWEGDGIPNRIDDLAAIARMDVKTFNAAWRKRLRVCFVKHQTKKGYLTHKRLDAQRRSHDELRAKRTAAINTRWDRVRALQPADTTTKTPFQCLGDTLVSELNGRSNTLLSPDCDLQSATKHTTARAAARRRSGTVARDSDAPALLLSAHATWLTGFADAFLARAPKGKPNYGQWSTSLKPLVEEHGSTEVVGQWQAYLGDLDDLKRFSPRWFATHFGTWGQDTNTTSSSKVGVPQSESVDEYLASFAGGSN